MLTDPFSQGTTQITKLLLDHGADPAKPKCAPTSVNCVIIAINCDMVQSMARYVRDGVDINFRPWTSKHGHVSPFEASALQDRFDNASHPRMFP